MHDAPSSEADLCEAMFAALGRDHPLPVIAAVVRGCARHAPDRTGGADLVAVERCARRRLSRMGPTTATRNGNGDC